MAKHDVIVVGAGSTGCVLAARLAENPSRRVLLVEAGPFYQSIDDFPPELASNTSWAGGFPGHPNNWSFVSTLHSNRIYPMPRGFAVGGSSTINGTYFVRGRPSDFDGWAALGNPEWSWEKVLPYYIRSETDLDFTGPLHGEKGPIPLKRISPERYHPVSAAFLQACLDAGYPSDPDKNDPSTLGVGPVVRNAVNGVRMNTAVTHLIPALKKYPNLSVSADTYVRRVVVENRRAVGIEIQRYGERSILRAGEIILTAGGIKSPHLLMLSGIGDRGELNRYGIESVYHSPGVGRNVMDHPASSIFFRTRELHAELGPGEMPLQIYLNISVPGFDVHDDVQIGCTSVALSTMLKQPTAKGKRSLLPAYMTHPISSLRALMKLPATFVLRQGMSQYDLQINCHLQKSRSTGSITLTTADPMAHPHIDLNFFSHPDDLPRLRKSVRIAVDLLERPSFQALGAKRVTPTDRDLLDDASLDKWIVANVFNTFHTSSGARMGPDSDPMAVVDQYGRVRGVDGLRVFDLSIAPDSIRRNTSATAVMIGERAAAFFN